MTASKTEPAVYAVALGLLADAQTVYDGGEYQWQCGLRVRQLVFESCVSMVLRPEDREALKPLPEGGFWFCGLVASASVFLPTGRLELYRWVEGQYGRKRVACFDFPSPDA